MERTYTNPPLIEAVCDLKFSGSQPWDWTVAGIFYEQIRNKFPIKEQLNIVETQVDTQQGKFIQKTSPQLQFANEMRHLVIRIRPDTLSIHQLPPYDGWIHFKKRIIEYLKIYREAHSSELTQVALNYVNQIEIPVDTELEDYFRVLPRVPVPIPQTFASLLFNVDIPYDSATNILKISMGSVVPKTKDKVAYVLGLNMYNRRGKAPSGNDIVNWLENAHEHIEGAFNASFTDRTHHEMFGENKK